MTISRHQIVQSLLGGSLLMPGLLSDTLASADPQSDLHLLGFDHTRLTYRHGGRDYRLTDVHGNVVKGLLA
jgi:hypothetical protein